MIIREARLADAAAWEQLRCELWPDGAEDHGKEIAAFFAGRIEEFAFVLVVEDESGSLIAVAELSVRYDVSGQADKKTGYVEGLFVKPQWRNQGIARKLLQLSRDWAQKNNCEAFASDRADRVVNASSRLLSVGTARRSYFLKRSSKALRASFGRPGLVVAAAAGVAAA